MEKLISNVGRLTNSVFDISPPVLREKMQDNNKQNVQMKNVTAIIRRNRTGNRIFIS